MFHAKRCTIIACWNVRTLGSLSQQSLPLMYALRTMKEKNIEILAVSESRWTGHGVTKIGSHTILHSGASSTHVHGVALSSVLELLLLGRLQAVCSFPYQNASSESGSRHILVMQPLSLSMHA